MRFRSRIDLWLLLLIGIPIAGLAGIAADLLFVEPSSANTITAGMALLAIAAALAWMVRTTEYVVQVERLTVRAGPFRWTIEVAAIKRIRPTRSALSSPALSLDRLEIQYMNGRFGDILLVSPADKDGFIQALRSKNPGIVVEPRH